MGLSNKNPSSIQGSDSKRDVDPTSAFTLSLFDTILYSKGPVGSTLYLNSSDLIIYLKNRLLAAKNLDSNGP